MVRASASGRSRGFLRTNYYCTNYYYTNLLATLASASRLAVHSWVGVGVRVGVGVGVKDEW